MVAMTNATNPIKWVHMFPVSEWILKIDRKHSAKLGSWKRLKEVEKIVNKQLKSNLNKPVDGDQNGDIHCLSSKWAIYQNGRLSNLVVFEHNFVP